MTESNSPVFMLGKPQLRSTRSGLVTEDRAISNFDRVSLTGAGRVIITQGSVESLTVEADDNLMQYLKTEVENGVLIIGFTDEVRNKSVQPSQKIIFELGVEEIVGLDLLGAGDFVISSLESEDLEIVITGAGDVEIISLSAKELEVSISGAGNVELAGQVFSQDVLLSGVGDYRATKLESQIATVVVSGVGSATVWATESLEVYIKGVGDVDYYGNPSLIQEVTGLGKLTSLGESQ